MHHSRPALIALAALAAGCHGARRVAPPLDPVRPALWAPADAPPSGVVARPQAPTPPTSGVVTASASSPLAVPAALPAGAEGAKPRRPREILVLTGGGSYGAFTAGLLHAWGKAGTRPEFDVISGVSTGALIAPLAFLGPKGEPALKRLYTEVRTRDIIQMRTLATVPFRDAAASSAPLRKILDTTLTPDFFDDLAAEHRKGRRLYVGTTNLDARRFNIWDLGAIACRGGDENRKLIVDVLLASSSIPGVFPPVPIEVELDGKKYTELHADGGVTSPLFLPLDVLEQAGRVGEGEPPARLTVVVAGKYHADPAPVKARVLKVLGASAATFLYGHLRAEVANLYHAAAVNNVTFVAASLRADYPAADGGLDFDPVEMTKLFEEGGRVGAAGPLWDAGPPERAPGDGAPIRTGRKFRSAP